MLLKEPWDVDSDTLPNIVPPHGLIIERQWYLHEQIRPFCPDEDKSVHCRHLQSQEEVAGVLHTLKLQLRLIQRARCQQQPLHLNADGSVVCVTRLGIIKEVALTSITPQLRTYLFFICNPLPVFLYLVCIHAVMPHVIIMSYWGCSSNPQRLSVNSYVHWSFDTSGFHNHTQDRFIHHTCRLGTHACRTLLHLQTQFHTTCSLSILLVS